MQMDVPSISIIIPIYNCEKYLRKCLDSVISQTYHNIEIICVNDGSTDSSIDILKSYDDERMQIISQKNGGLSVARNTGASYAKGKYLYFLDSDDYIDDSLLESMYLFSEENRLDLCEGKTVFQYVDYQKKYSEYNKADVFVGYQNILSFYIEDFKRINAWNKLIKREILSCVKDMFIPRQISEDYLWLFNVLLPKITRAGYCESVGVYHYVKNNSGSITNKHSEQHLDSYLSIFDELCKNSELVNICVLKKSSMLGDLLFLALKESLALLNYDEYKKKSYAKIRENKQFFVSCNIKRKFMVKLSLFANMPFIYRILVFIFERFAK